MHERDAFRIRDALADGIGRGELAGPRYRAPFHGVRTAAAAPIPAHLAFLPLLRTRERYSHITAARILGAPLPASAEDLIHVAGPAGVAQHRGRGVVGHRDEWGAMGFGGVPVSPPGRLLIELGSLLRIDDLVAVADYLLLEPRVRTAGRPFTTLDELTAITATARSRGVRPARAAVGLARPGVESPMETALRLLLLEAGLPEPVCGYELRDSRGRRIGWFDLAWPRHRVLGEYDGDQHRTSDKQYDRDIMRYDRATDEGWRAIRIRAAGMRRNARRETVARFAHALQPGPDPHE